MSKFKCVLVVQLHVLRDEQSVLDFPQQPKQLIGPAQSMSQHLIHGLPMQKVLDEYPAFSTTKTSTSRACVCYRCYYR